MEAVFLIWAQDFMLEFVPRIWGLHPVGRVREYAVARFVEALRFKKVQGSIPDTVIVI